MLWNFKEGRGDFCALAKLTGIRGATVARNIARLEGKQKQIRWRHMFENIYITYRRSFTVPLTLS